MKNFFANVFPDKVMTLSATLHTIVGMLTPVAAVLAQNEAIDARAVAVMIVGGLIGGASGLLAFLSTTYARSRYTVMEKPEE